eukprot:GFYU01000844.1.p1 GENE.GFYU01000844.1~~GFYU01000844.1.p1  ORF type:complete len:221 (-),score=55.76 GFYU01000844.1:190-852(-)
MNNFGSAAGSGGFSPAAMGGAGRGGLGGGGGGMSLSNMRSNFNKNHLIAVGVLLALFLLIILLVVFLAPRDPCVAFKSVTFTPRTDGNALLDMKVTFNVQNPNYVDMAVTLVKLEVNVGGVGSVPVAVSVVQNESGSEVSLNQEKKFAKRSKDEELSLLVVLQKGSKNYADWKALVDDALKDANAPTFVSLQVNGFVKSEYLSTYAESPLGFTLPVPALA